MGIGERGARRLAPTVAVAVASGVFLAWWLHWFDFVDLEVYRAGANALLHGHDIYQAHPAASPLPFTYPPFAAMVFVPLAVLPDLAARVAMPAASVGALVLATSVALRLAAPLWSMRTRRTATIAVCAAALWMEPIRDTLRFGQVNLILMALVLSDVAAIRPRGRGVAVGLATAIKLTPGIFILYLLVTRRTRQATTALATGAVATLAAFAVMPSASTRYWTHLVFDDSRIGNPGFVWNQSLRGVVARLAGSAHRDRLVWLLAAAVVLLAGLALAVRAERSGDELLGVALAAVTGLLVSPVSWDHHWVWALPVAIALWRQRGVAALWTAVFLLAPMSWWAFAGADDYRLGAVQNLAAASFVLAGLALLAFLALRPPVAARRADASAPHGSVVGLRGEFPPSGADESMRSASS